MPVPIIFFTPWCKNERLKVRDYDNFQRHTLTESVWIVPTLPKHEVGTVTIKLSRLHSSAFYYLLEVVTVKELAFV